MSEYQQPQSPTEDNDMDEDYDGERKLGEGESIGSNLRGFKFEPDFLNKPTSELDLEELVNRASRRMGTRKS